MGENRHKDAIDSVTSGWTLGAAICTLPIYILFGYFGDSGRGRAAWVSAISTATAARFVWDLKKHAWFWVTIAMIVILHVPLILFVPWGNQNLSYIALLPLALLDFGITYGIIRLVENAVKEDAPPGTSL